MDNQRAEATRPTQFLNGLLASGYMNISSQYGAEFWCHSACSVELLFINTGIGTDLNENDIHNIIQEPSIGASFCQPQRYEVLVIFLTMNTHVNDTGLNITMREASSDIGFRLSL